MYIYIYLLLLLFWVPSPFSQLDNCSIVLCYYWWWLHEAATLLYCKYSNIMGNKSSKSLHIAKDQNKSEVSSKRPLRIKGVASDTWTDEDSAPDWDDLRQQRLRLSLDVQGEQLEAIHGKKTPRMPPTLLAELAKPPPVAAKNTKRKGNETDRYGKDDLVAGRKVQGVVEASSELLNLTYGTFSLAGWEPVRELRDGQQARKENQDAFCCHESFGGRKDEAFFGIFDGHGARGKSVAEFVRDVLPTVVDSQLKQLSQQEEQDDETTTTAKNSTSCIEWKGKRQLDIVKAAIQGFIDCSKILNSPDSRVDTFMSGTTAVVAWFCNTLLFCCNLGDSRCVIGRQCHPSAVSRLTKEKYVAVELSYDQKPDRQDETQRVVAAGGRVASWQSGVGPLRVWLADEWIPGLAMTRSFGDSLLHSVGVLDIPEVTCIQLSEVDKFCVLASDGVWEFMSSQEVVDFVGKYRRKYSAQEAAEFLVQEAVKRWRKNEHVVDDVTAIVIWIECKVASPPNSSTRGQQRGVIALQDGEVLQGVGSSNSSGGSSLWHSWKNWSFRNDDSNKNNNDNHLGYQPVLIDKNGTLKSFIPENHQI